MAALDPSPVMPPGIGTDGVPVTGQLVLLGLILLGHGAMLALTLLFSRPQQGMAVDQKPGVLQVSWITRERPEPPATPEPVEIPKPLPVKPQPPRVARPKARPVLAIAAEVEAPVAAVHETFQVQEETPEDGGSPAPPGPQADSGLQAGAAAVVTPPRFNADYLSNPAPEYPPLSRQLREQGVVRLRVFVSADGRAEKVLLHKSSGFARLDQAALDVVWRWRFVPAQRGGMAVADWVIVPINFVLRR
jgi:protein TonB